MNKMFRIVICLELLIIGIIILKINFDFHKKKYSIHPIDMSEFKKTPTENLKYFYEMGLKRTEKIHKSWLGYEPIYTINSDSMNERYDYQVNKREDVYRIITLGDSFTFGIYVSTPDNWTELLEKRLNDKCRNSRTQKFEVINLGVPGYDTQYEYQRYVLRGQKYNPDLVIWTFRDFEGSWEQMQPIMEANLKIYQKNEEIFQSDKSMLLREGQPEENLSTKKLVASSMALRKMTKSLNRKDIVAFQKKYISAFEMNFKKSLIYVDISEEGINKDDFYFLSILRPRLLERPDTYYLKPLFIMKQGNYRLPDYHFNKLGNKLMEDSIFEYLKKNKIIVCSP